MFLNADDHTRVKLEIVDDDPLSDYINANYIDVSALYFHRHFLKNFVNCIS